MKLIKLNGSIIMKPFAVHLFQKLKIDKIELNELILFQFP
jgi:hypothetical protein